MTKRVAMIFLVFSIIVIGVSIWSVASHGVSLRRTGEEMDAPYPADPFDGEVGQDYSAVIMNFDGDQEFFVRTGLRACTLSEIDYGDAYWEAGRLDEPPFVACRRVFPSLRVAHDP